MAPTPPTRLDQLRGATVLVTGGSSGIGLATVAALSRADAEVVVAARDTDRAARATAALSRPVEVRRLDLADLSSVREFAAAWDRPLEVLVNNAGVSVPTLRRSVDGFELTFGTNHLGPYALTNLLLPHVTGRVVTVASLAERAARLDLDDLDLSRTPYQESLAYNRSKLANLLFTAELQRRLTAAGSPVRALAAHPGFVRTDIYAQTTGLVARTMVRLLAQEPDQGALPVLLAATGDLPGGTFVGPEHLAHMRGGAEVIRASRQAGEPALAARLWDLSAELTGVPFGLAPART